MLIDDRREQVRQQAELRFRQRTAERGEVERKIQGGMAVGKIDSRERVAKRLARLRSKGMETRDEILFERTIGGSDFMPLSYLERGLQVAGAVARVWIRDDFGRSLGYGTGFLVSPRLLLTNNHVLADPEEAAHSLAQFNYQYPLGASALVPVSFALEPAAFFLTDPTLDYSLVAVRETSAEGRPLRDFGWLPLIEEEGKVVLSEFVSIIQHPAGEPKQLALRENQLVDLLDQFLHYRTDTERGSSGSPVFNDEWEVVGVHHSGVPDRNAQGQILARDGSVWEPAMGTDQVHWVANEGVRISRIVRHVRGQSLPAALEPLRRQFLEPGLPEAAPAVSADAVAVRAQFDREGHATWMVPVEIKVRVGSVPAVAAAGPAAVVPAGRASGPEPPGLRVVLDAAREARKKTYYARKRDRQDRDAYYAAVPASATPRQMFEALRDLLTSTHTTRPPYRPSVEVYPWVDVQPDRKLRSIYSEMLFEPEELIREEFLKEEEFFAREAVLAANESLSAQERARELDLLEASMKFNCEHVVPQSWFNKKEPMRGDLHHLFTCEWGCNSFRGNTAYFDFVDFPESVPESFDPELEALRQQCGRREEPAVTGDGLRGFEPHAGKGEAARAVLYFLLRYPGQINLTQEFTRARLDTLLAWHREFRVTRHELHRNMAIFARQGNRNPLIDHPEWAERTDFSLALG